MLSHEARIQPAVVALYRDHSAPKKSPRNFAFGIRTDRVVSGRFSVFYSSSRRNLEARGGIEPPIKVLQTLSRF